MVGHEMLARLDQTCLDQKWMSTGCRKLNQPIPEPSGPTSAAGGGNRRRQMPRCCASDAAWLDVIAGAESVVTSESSEWEYSFLSSWSKRDI